MASSFDLLLCQDLTRRSNVYDMQGQPFQALAIFTMAIQYLKNHFLSALNRQVLAVKETDIQYVITVPAIWSDSAKQFMREAAIKAGIDGKRLKLALEPESASICCSEESEKARIALAGIGTRSMVIDLGGGTADISVHERKEDKTLKEIHKASGGPWGGIYVDENYLQWLRSIFGSESIDKLKNEAVGDYMDLLRQFETKKRAHSTTVPIKTTIRLPNSLRTFVEKAWGKDIGNVLSQKGLTLVSGDKVRVKPSIFDSWFDGPLNKVISHVKELLKEDQMKSVQIIMLVGGFGGFKAFVSMGDEVKLNKEISDEFTTNSPEMSLIEIYQSTSKLPYYVADADCTKLGDLIVHHPNGPQEKEKKIDVTFIFGETELVVKKMFSKLFQRKDTSDDRPSDAPPKITVKIPHPKPKKENILLVAAFDFGTTYSGFAFSFHNDPMNIQTQNWVAGSEKLISPKTPSCVLLNPKGEFDSFGFFAENKYVDLAEEDKHTEWRFFRRFKMVLHDNKAGIKDNRLKLALEPEAASLWCIENSENARIAMAGTGTRNMVVDLGGGTADISVHERKENGTVKEVHKASGGPWGGIYVDENYMKWIASIFGQQAVDDMKKYAMGDYFDILREFETKKRAHKTNTATKTTLRVSSILRAYAEKHSGMKLEEMIAKKEFGDTVVLRGGDKLRIESSVMDAWFNEPVDRLIAHLKELLKEERLKSVKNIMVMGCFDAFVKAGDEVEVNAELSKEFPANSQEMSLIEIYQSAKPEPWYVNDSECTKLGDLLISHPGAKQNKRKIDVTFIFGETELVVKWRIHETGNEEFLKINCLH
ncbi:HS12B-like protein [Mya arenaria]|uniref:HS12B-like protein n=1 Tax=Mya arenaria TaxID=6604 RepID=A0ABY7E1J6_MYAAR|nr:HS12B-like protein [Mya arenaria]